MAPCNWPHEICCGTATADLLLDEILASAASPSWPLLQRPTLAQLDTIEDLVADCRAHVCAPPLNPQPLALPTSMHKAKVVAAWKKACAGPNMPSVCDPNRDPESVPNWDGVIDELDHGGGTGDTCVCDDDTGTATPPSLMCNFGRLPIRVKRAISVLVGYFERHGDPDEPWATSREFCRCLEEYLRSRAKSADRGRSVSSEARDAASHD